MSDPVLGGQLSDELKVLRVTLACRLTPRQVVSWLSQANIPLEASLKAAEREGHLLATAVINGRLGRLEQALRLFAKVILKAIEEYMDEGKKIEAQSKSLKGLQKANYVLLNKANEVDQEILPPEFHLSTILFAYEASKDHLSKIDSVAEKKVLTQRFLDDILKIKAELDKLAENAASTSRWSLSKTMKFMELHKFITESIIVELLGRCILWFGVNWINELVNRPKEGDPNIGSIELIMLLHDIKIYSKFGNAIKSKLC